MLPALAAFCVACAAASAWAAEPARPIRARANLRGGAAERRAAAELAQRRGPGAPSAAELDAAAAAETNPQVRYELLRGLTTTDPVAALPALTRALRSDPAPIVRVAAAQELGRLDSDRTAARALIAALAGDSDLNVRRAAASSLGVSRSTEAAAALAAAAEQADPGVRRQAAQALAARAGRAARRGGAKR